MTKTKIQKLIRSKRKTLALEIGIDGSLIVRAPERTSFERIDRLVHKKRFWIREKQKMAREKYRKVFPKEFVSGEGFLYLGDTYRLFITNDGDIPLSFGNEFQLSKNYLPRARQLFIDWYRREAYRKIKQRLNWYCMLSGLTYNKFNITDAQKRWGSCRREGNLNFSWRLIMAPLNAIDYVVVHELVHTKEKNHSKKFWQKVKLINPSFEKGKEWLHNEGHTLVF